MDVPFHLKRQYIVPIKITFDGPIYLEFDENLNVQHQLNPTLAMNDPITMRKIAAFDATMYNTVQQSKADLELKMNVPLKSIHP